MELPSTKELITSEATWENIPDGLNKMMEFDKDQKLQTKSKPAMRHNNKIYSSIKMKCILYCSNGCGNVGGSSAHSRMTVNMALTTWPSIATTATNASYVNSVSVSVSARVYGNNSNVSSIQLIGDISIIQKNKRIVRCCLVKILRKDKGNNNNNIYNHWCTPVMIMVIITTNILKI